ncbi:unnamed protein product [Polarella glacialis]|uniref:Cytochrome P450 n=1 Tax=Polarella glacialis TaxID=89957 RepID=A0A813G3T7_POLGL|nr:unnamed protein product [Polarella glacialis]CAE8621232.1 unnamed protein product [Polarella glacialis]CAE8693051.1 unnamed protein product [Polarella glacialis]
MAVRSDPGDAVACIWRASTVPALQLMHVVVDQIRNSLPTSLRDQPLRCAVYAYAAYFSASFTLNFIVRPCLRKREASRTAEQLPNSSPSLFWGHFRDIFETNQDRVYDRMREFFHNKAKTAQLATPFFDLTPVWIITIDARNVKHILQDSFDNYIKTDVNTKALPKMLNPGEKQFVGDGIFAIDHGPHAEDAGKSWKMQRKFAMQILNKTSFQTHMCDCFQKQAMNSCAWITNQGAQPVDLQDVFRRFTMESVGNIFFNMDFDLLNPANTSTKLGFGACFDEVTAASVRLKSPSALLYALSDLCPHPLGHVLSHLYWSGSEQRLFLAKCAELRSYAYDIICTSRKDPLLGARRDLLALFLNARQEDGTPLDDKMLVELVISFALAGRDTTASLLSWTAFLLTQNLHVQIKLREEVFAQLGQAVPTYKDMDKMPYLRGVLWEVLRLRPVVPLDMKTAVKADVLPDGTYVPRNANVLFFPFGVGLDQERWGQDVQEMRPERWIGKPLPSAFDFPVFQAGPRICPGINMALFEAGVMLATLMQHFELTLAGSAEEVRYDQNEVMGIKGELLVKATPLEVEERVDSRKDGA